jgi:hypothetical protein
LRELASVGLPVVVDLAVEVRLLALQILGFAGGQLPGLDAIGDAVLLIVAPLIHSGRVLRKRYRTTKHACDENDSIDFHDDFLSPPGKRKTFGDKKLRMS